MLVPCTQVHREPLLSKHRVKRIITRVRRLTIDNACNVVHDRDGESGANFRCRFVRNRRDDETDEKDKRGRGTNVFKRNQAGFAG